MIYEQDISYILLQCSNDYYIMFYIYNSLDLISLKISVLDSSGLDLRSGQTKD